MATKKNRRGAPLKVPPNRVGEHRAARAGVACANTTCVTVTQPANAAWIHGSPSPPACTDRSVDSARIKMATEGQSDYESVLCVKPEVNVYRIPPRASNRAVR